VAYVFVGHLARQQGRHEDVDVAAEKPATDAPDMVGVGLDQQGPESIVDIDRIRDVGSSSRVLGRTARLEDLHRARAEFGR
jgi:hypothetical protein